MTQAKWGNEVQSADAFWGMQTTSGQLSSEGLGRWPCGGSVDGAMGSRRSNVGQDGGDGLEVMVMKPLDDDEAEGESRTMS